MTELLGLFALVAGFVLGRWSQRVSDRRHVRRVTGRLHSRPSSYPYTGGRVS